jgi:hypothetical protein
MTRKGSSGFSFFGEYRSTKKNVTKDSEEAFGNTQLS